MLAYVGPESIMPVASGIAAFFGFLLLGWRWIANHVKRAFRFLFRIKPPVPEADPEMLNKTEPTP